MRRCLLARPRRLEAAGIVAGFVALFAAVGPARADDLETLLEEQVVSTASKALESASTAPATSTVITAEDLHRFGIRTLDEAINFLAMGAVVETPIHDGEIGVRGTHFTGDYGNHVLLLLDGHALNEPWDGTAYFERGTGVPLEIVDHIEVVLGPGSVLYGSNAMLAVINVVTKRAKDWEGVHAVVESELPISIRGAAGFAHGFRLFGKAAEVTGELEYFGQRGHGFTLGPERERPPVPLELGGAPRASWGGVADRDDYAVLPSGYLRAVIGDLEVDVRAVAWKRGTPTLNTDVFDDPANYEVERWLSGDVKYRAVLGQRVDLTSRLYGDSYDYVDNYPIADGYCVSGMPRGCTYRLLGASRWAGLEEQLSIDWLKDGTVTTLIGVDGRLRHVGSKTDYVEYQTHRTPGSFNPYDIGEEALGAYAQQVVRPTRWLALNAGVRLDADSTFDPHLSPRAAINVTPWGGGTLKAIYSEAFRAPTTYERYYADPLSEVAAPDLRPETVRSFELAFDQRARGQHLVFGVFRTLFDDLVLATELGAAEVARYRAEGALAANVRSAMQFQNKSSADAWGFNAGIDGALVGGKLRYAATLTGAVARYQPSSSAPAQELAVAPQVSGNARVAYEHGGLWPVPALAARFVGEREAAGAPVEAPVWVELRATVSGKLPVVDGLHYRASVDYVSTRSAPYVVGPGTLPSGAVELAPVDQLRTGVALYYDWKP